MTQPVYVVDAFTSQPFRGNPAGVVPLTEPCSEDWMQSVAAELNLSETAFVDVSADVQPKSLRWFTPLTEVDLCGHATLATAHVLGGDQQFSTRSGLLTCRALPDDWIAMDFPADPSRNMSTDASLSAALPGVEIQQAAAARGDVLVVLESAEAVLAARPDIGLVAQLPYRGLILTASASVDDEADFVSRCFYPRVGVPEDPVTGSAHCTLASWWCERLGRAQLVGRQASARGGLVRVALRGDRVELAGRAVTVLAGDLVGAASA